MKIKYYLRGLGIGIVVTALIMGIAYRGRSMSMSDEEIKARAAQLGMVESNSSVLADLAANKESKPAGDSESPDDSKLPSESGSNASDDEDNVSEESSMGTGENIADDGDEASSIPYEKDAQSVDSTKPSDKKVSGPEEGESPDSTKSNEEQNTSDSTKPIPGNDVASDSSNMNNQSIPDAGTEHNSDDTAGTGTSDAVSITVKRGDSSVTVSRALAEAGLVEDAKTFDRYLCANGYDKKISIGTYHIAPGTSEEDIAKTITKRR